MTDSELRPIRRLLVANRGEIARRIFRAARAMGISTVAVYADGDAEAPFVTDADLSVPLGGRTATETYLSARKVIAAAEASDADAVHPGYGFLSENAEFAQAVIDAGLVWVGPPPEAIAAMGDKLAAKETMTAAGVPTLPSIAVTDDMDSERLAAAAADIGFPVLVKASAGGGGKGMRIVDEPSTLTDAVAAARREAAGAFGDDTVFLERYLAAPRHVEIQVLGDTQGNIIHCFERECSIQRRHQKVIEEAPSPAVTPALRERMGAAAVAAVSTIGYCSAGTVEFLLEGSGDDAEFWFLEVNTRLQVEHPVTEEITGLDLVREQIRIAAGEPLGYGQADIGICGHAIEARLYAEDPASGFLPQTGTIDLWRPATGFRALADSVARSTRTCADDTSDGLPATGGPNSASSWARFDSGIEAGSVVGTEFDPMLAKVIVAAPTRTEAALGLASALERTRLGGVVTNRDFLCAVLRSDEFLAGDTTTDFIDRVYFGHVEAGDEPAAASLPRNRRAIRCSSTRPLPQSRWSPRSATGVTPFDWISWLRGIATASCPTRCCRCRLRSAASSSRPACSTAASATGVGGCASGHCRRQGRMQASVTTLTTPPTQASPLRLPALRHTATGRYASTASRFAPSPTQARPRPTA